MISRPALSGDRHGVEVAGDHHSLGPTKFGSSEDDVPVPQHLHVAVFAQHLFHAVGDLCFLPADRLDVDQCTQQLDYIATRVETRRHERHLTASVGSSP
jgi:hypothetical protein